MLKKLSLFYFINQLEIFKIQIYKKMSFHKRNISNNEDCSPDNTIEEGYTITDMKSSQDSYNLKYYQLAMNMGLVFALTCILIKLDLSYWLLRFLN